MTNAFISVLEALTVASSLTERDILIQRGSICSNVVGVIASSFAAIDENSSALSDFPLNHKAELRTLVTTLGAEVIVMQAYCETTTFQTPPTKYITSSRLALLKGMGGVLGVIYDGFKETGVR